MNEDQFMFCFGSVILTVLVVGLLVRYIRERFFPKQLQNLDEWLDLATQCLVPSAQQRLRAEIAAHHAESVQHYLAEGLPKAAAHTRALTDLGNAHAAACRYRRQYLTQREAKVFSTSAKNWPAMLLAQAVGWFGTAFLLLRLPEPSRLPDGFWATLLFATLVVMLGTTAGAHFFLRQQLPRVKFLRYNLLSMIQLLNTVVLLAIDRSLMPKPSLSLHTLAGTIGAILVVIFSLYALRRKIRAVPDEDLPPPSRFAV